MNHLHLQFVREASVVSYQSHDVQVYEIKVHSRLSYIVVLFARAIIVGAFSENSLKKYCDAIIRIGLHASDCVQASPSSERGEYPRPEAEGGVEHMYTYAKQESGGVLVHDIGEFFNKLTYEVRSG